MNIILKPSLIRSISVFNQNELKSGTTIYIDNAKAQIIKCGPFNIIVKTDSYVRHISLSEVEKDNINLMSETEYYKSLLKMA